MNIMVLNAGSGSQKCSFFQIGKDLPGEPLEPVWKAAVEATFPGQVADELLLSVTSKGQPEQKQTLPADLPRAKRIEKIMDCLGKEHLAAIDAVGHRVVHGGTHFVEAMLVNAQVEADISELSAFAPLHNPANLDGIQGMRKIFGEKVPQIAVFDTSFHRTLADGAAVYPGPHEWLARGIRRYGFHGTSFRWATQRAAHLLGRENDPALRLIICHLGGGCSLAATIGGKSVDTTMGFTPLDGIAMCTRSGALDPGILLFLMRENPNVDELEKVLNKSSGLAGLSGLSGDTRIILAAAETGNPRAKLAMEVFVHRLQAGIGQMLAALQGMPDALVFTDAIGEDEPLVRSRACDAFKFLGMEIDPEKNAGSLMDADISKAGSQVKILIVKGREDWEIARQSHDFLKEKPKTPGLILET